MPIQRIKNNNPIKHPTFTRIKRKRQTVMITDATRWLNDAAEPGEGGWMTFGVDPNENITMDTYGNFLCGLPAYENDVSWERLEAAGSRYTGRDNASIRHEGNNAINVTYFDGSGGTLRRPEIYGEVKHWVPRGSTFTGVSAVPEVRARYGVGELVDLTSCVACCLIRVACLITLFA
ncbi:MAG: hypothetical protein F6K17_08615 [Okeania sp. SIO3C4]|nr:hypothetical protein [Okeania sp. SIO3C4]